MKRRIPRFKLIVLGLVALATALFGGLIVGDGAYEAGRVRSVQPVPGREANLAEVDLPGRGSQLLLMRDRPGVGDWLVARGEPATAGGVDYLGVEETRTLALPGGALDMARLVFSRALEPLGRPNSMATGMAGLILLLAGCRLLRGTAPIALGGACAFLAWNAGSALSLKTSLGGDEAVRTGALIAFAAGAIAELRRKRGAAPALGERALAATGGALCGPACATALGLAAPPALFLAVGAFLAPGVLVWLLGSQLVARGMGIGGASLLPLLGASATAIHVATRGEWLPLHRLRRRP